jgi:glutamate-1-semialdehyde aminotransferase
VAIAQGIDRRRIERLIERELVRFLDERPRSAELIARGSASMPRGVPMSWMTQEFGHPPIFIERGEGAYITDVDGHRYFDTNIADTSMFCGYSPEPVVRAVSLRIGEGAQFLMPTEDAVWVAEELARRWRVPKWQFTLSATFANTEAIRVSRHVTGRPKLLMFSGKYHGHADEMLVTERDGQLEPQYLGLQPSVAEHVVLVGFNDVEAVERALAPGDVACVLTEPALTNVGVIQPDPGFHAELRRLTREAGTLLILDETHTLICGPGGLVDRWSLEPDIVTLGKSIGAGVAIGAYGMIAPVAAALEDQLGDYGGGDFVPELATGGTLFGNALQMAASRAALGEVLTPEAYERTSALGERLADGIEQVTADAGLPWRAHRLFARSGFAFDGTFARNAPEAHRSHDSELYRLLRLFMVNRGVWEAMEWAGPAVSVAAAAEDVDTYLGVLAALAEELTA